MISTLVGCCVLIAMTLADGDPILVLSKSSPVFSQALYQQIALNKSSVVYSPYSIQAALGLLLLGAGEGTASAEIKNVAFLNPGLAVNVAFNELFLQWNNVTKVQIFNANGMFVNPRYPIERQFVQSARLYYFASCTQLDLVAPEGPEKAVNNFVEQQTKHFIRDLLQKHTIDNATAAIVVNAVFFNATWQKQFNTGRTHKNAFYTLDRGTIQLDTMHDLQYVSVKRNVFGADIIGIPFRERFSLYIALPQANDGIIQLERDLSAPGAVSQLFEGAHTELAHLSLPKFTVESELKLKEPLEKMGIMDVFSGSPDLSKISKVDGLHISDIIHKAIIEVRETGTVAAAATAVVVQNVAHPLPPQFKVDHPFVFFLRDRETNVILFQGKYGG